MTDFREQAIAWGEMMAGLSPDERKAAENAARTAYVAGLDDSEVEEKNRPPVHTLGEFLDTKIEVPPMLVEPGIVARGALTALISKGGKGKTTLSFNRLMRWAVGKPLFDELPDVFKPTKPLTSLIIENEGGGWHTQSKLHTILHNNGYSEEELEQIRERVHVWGDGGWSSLRLDDTGNLDTVKRGLDAVQPDILFLEPFRLLWRGEENSSTEMMRVMESFFELANAHNCAVMVTHHESKGTILEGGDAMEKGRGSTVFTDLGAVMERWAPAGAHQREWTLTKWRFKDPPASVRMTYDRDRESYAYVPEDANIRHVRETLIAHAGEWLTVQEIRDEMDADESEQTVRKWLQKGVQDDLVLRRKNPLGGPAWQYCVSETADEDDNSTAPLPVS